MCPQELAVGAPPAPVNHAMPGLTVRCSAMADSQTNTHLLHLIAVVASHLPGQIWIWHWQSHHPPLPNRHLACINMQRVIGQSYYKHQTSPPVTTFQNAPLIGTFHLRHQVFYVVNPAQIPRPINSCQYHEFTSFAFSVFPHPWPQSFHLPWAVVITLHQRNTPSVEQARTPISIHSTTAREY